MRKRRTGFLWVVGATSLALLASLLVGAAPATAASDMTVKWVRVNTATCAVDDGEGGLRVVNQLPAGCFIGDSADNTFFQRDVGGLALKMEFYVGNTMAAKVEFHPYDHKLWVYDTLSNNDTIYVDACRVSGRICILAADDVKGVNHPPEIVTLALAEGTRVNIDVYDREDNVDFIRSQFGRA